VYRYLIEGYTKYKVSALTCIASKDRRYYPIDMHSKEYIEELLYGSAAKDYHKTINRRMQ
jgi:hypothetical protein